MRLWTRAVADAVTPGLVAGVLFSAAAAAYARRDSGSAVSAINAPSHVLWGERATRQRHLALRYSLPGLLLNLGAGVFWGVVMQGLRAALPRRHGFGATLGAGAAASGLAWVVDYHLIPRRLSPGIETRISPRSLLWVHAVFGAALGAAAWLNRPRERQAEMGDG